MVMHSNKRLFCFFYMELLAFTNYKLEARIANLCEPLCTLRFKPIFIPLLSLMNSYVNSVMWPAAGITAEILFASGHLALRKKIAADEPGRCHKTFIT